MVTWNTCRDAACFSREKCDVFFLVCRSFLFDSRLDVIRIHEWKVQKSVMLKNLTLVVTSDFSNFEIAQNSRRISNAYTTFTYIRTHTRTHHTLEYGASHLD